MIVRHDPLYAILYVPTEINDFPIGNEFMQGFLCGSIILIYFCPKSYLTCAND